MNSIIALIIVIISERQEVNVILKLVQVVFHMSPQNNLYCRRRENHGQTVSSHFSPAIDTNKFTMQSIISLIMFPRKL